VLQFKPYGACTAATPTSVVCDRGARASDAEDGDLTTRVTACGGRWSTRGVGACAVNTSLPGRYTVRYVVTDSGGVEASANRTVEVSPVCSAGERLCADGVTCSVAGACTLDLTLDTQLDQVNEEDNAEKPPTLTLRTAAALSRYVEVRRFGAFAACAPGVGPTEEALCEPGADAVDHTGVNLTAAVLACPPVECLSTGCPGHQVGWWRFKSKIEYKRHEKPPETEPTHRDWPAGLTRGKATREVKRWIF